MKADVFHVFDNNGVYNQGTGGQGINSSSIVSVWTNRLLILKKDSFIQRDSKYSTRSQSKRREADLGLFYFNSGATEKACENDENKSPFTDLEYFNGELRLLLDEVIADRADYNNFLHWTMPTK